MIDPARLDEILEVLRENGVASFSCAEFSVALTPSVPSSEVDVSEAIKTGNEALNKPAAHGVFGHQSLWGPDGPPSFPREERSRE